MAYDKDSSWHYISILSSIIDFIFFIYWWRCFKIETSVSRIRLFQTLEIGHYKIRSLQAIWPPKGISQKNFRSESFWFQWSHFDQFDFLELVFSRNFKSPENEGYSYRLTLTLAYNESDRTFGRQHTTRDFSIYLDKQGKSSKIRFDRI